MNAFTLKGSEFSEALDRVLLAIPPSELAVYGFIIGKKNIKLFGLDQDRVVTALLSSVRQCGTGEFFIADAATLKTAVKGREDITLEFLHDKMQFTSGKFRGDLKLVDPGSSSRADLKLGMTIDSESSLLIDKDFFKSLGDGVKVARLKNPYNDNYIPSATIIYDGKNLTVLGNDEFHMHIYKRKIKSKTQPLKITIPIGIFSTLDRIIKDDATFYITEDRLFIRGKNIAISLPPIDAEVDLEYIESFMSSIGKPTKSFTLGSTFTTAFTGIAGYFKKGVSSLTLTTKKERLTLHYQNDGGSIEDDIKVKDASGSDVTAKIDPVVFEDSFKNIRACKKIDFGIFCNKQGQPLCYRMETEYCDGDLTIFGYFKE